jgi:hypothetical protein
MICSVKTNGKKEHRNGDSRAGDGMELLVHIPRPAVFLSEVCRTGKAVDDSQVSHRFESSLPIFACSSSPKLQETQS